ncbi:hypothetical protein UFOVP222_126 [uncultured Caudovirales phage]|uniref:Uncharacterized protein n=1 Tax=uncultured Caudovirales phage TaxID=2100421 RepID=A0A6J7WSI8_9CAUD|nr:hypothetical protein UFOVP108_121 [uncultured Caudovirales phage]CAB5219755.1 hypothetical protein UFOVP222_126 [uncultured Caudovirales phage]
MTEIGKFSEYGQPDFAMEEVAVEPAVSNHPVLIALNEKIEKLEKELAEKETYRASVADQIRSVRYDHEKKKLALKDLLVEFIEDETLDYDYAKQIADIFDILLTKRIEIEYKITALVTIEVPVNADEDQVADNVYCDRVDFSTYDSDHEILETDFDVEDWTVRS